MYFADETGSIPSIPDQCAALLFSFDYSRTGRKGGGIDPTVSNTIIHFLFTVLEASPDLILLYYCSRAGGVHRKRNELFQSWFSGFNSDYVKHDYTDGGDVFISAIFRKNHLYELEIKESLQQLDLDKR